MVLISFILLLWSRVLKTDSVMGEVVVTERSSLCVFSFLRANEEICWKLKLGAIFPIPICHVVNINITDHDFKSLFNLKISGVAGSEEEHEKKVCKLYPKLLSPIFRCHGKSHTLIPFIHWSISFSNWVESSLLLLLLKALPKLPSSDGLKHSSTSCIYFSRGSLYTLLWTNIVFSLNSSSLSHVFRKESH